MESRVAAMESRVAMEAEQAVLQCIAALLLALADLAERAAGRSRPVRGLVLWLLYPVEAVARDLVAGSALAPPLRPPGDSRADAIRLAASLRSLAASLRDLFGRTPRHAGDPSCLPGGPIGFLFVVEGPIGACPMTPSAASSTALQPPPDTS